MPWLFLNELSFAYLTDIKTREKVKCLNSSKERGLFFIKVLRRRMEEDRSRVKADNNLKHST